MFSEVGGQQAADTIVRKEHVKVPQKTALGLVRFILRFQDLVWDDLWQTKMHMTTTVAFDYKFLTEQKSANSVCESLDSGGASE